MKIKELFSSPDRWGKYNLASNDSGVAVPLNAHMTFDVYNRPVPAGDCRYCLYGAIIACYPQMMHKEIGDKLDAALVARGFPASYISWNDSPSVQFEDVKALVEELDI